VTMDPEVAEEQRVDIDPVVEGTSTQTGDDDAPPTSSGVGPQPEPKPKLAKRPTAYLVLVGKKDDTNGGWYEVGVFTTHTKREAKHAALTEDPAVQALYEDRNLKIVAVPARSWEPTTPEPDTRIKGL